MQVLFWMCSFMACSSIFWYSYACFLNRGSAFKKINVIIPQQTDEAVAHLSEEMYDFTTILNEVPRDSEKAPVVKNVEVAHFPRPLVFSLN